MKNLVFVFVGGCLTLLGLVQLGCDDDSDLDGQYIRINPESVTLAQVNKSLSLTVEGGQPPYVWTATDSTLGAVSGSGRTVTYTRTAQNGVNTVRVTDGQTWSGKATITQQDDLDPMAISPASATLQNDGDKVGFTGSGGGDRYKWSVGNSARGRLDISQGTQVIYSRIVAGDNTVILHDRSGHAAVATIAQPAAATLSVNPTSASVATNGGTQVFQVVGGKPPFNWGFSGAAHGTLNPMVGQTSLYTSSGAGTDIIQVTDNNGSVAYVTVTKN
jgi:hypothetical protein